MKKSTEANLISFKVLVTDDNKIYTEFSQLPIDKVDSVFNKNDRVRIKAIIRHVKRRMNPLHEELQNELSAIN